MVPKITCKATFFSLSLPVSNPCSPYNPHSDFSEGRQKLLFCFSCVHVCTATESVIQTEGGTQSRGVTMNSLYSK